MRDSHATEITKVLFLANNAMIRKITFSLVIVLLTGGSKIMLTPKFFAV